MSEVTLNTNCPNCSQEFSLGVPFQDLSPMVRSKIKPIGNIWVYRISSEEIKQFIMRKAKYFKEGTKVEVVTKYCEKKNSNPHRGYASLRIAFSDDVIEKKGSGDWYEKIGEHSGNVRFIQNIFVGMIQKYQYSKKDLENILGNYKNLEKVENQLGMTEAFIEDIKMYSTPKRVPTNNNESWIIFSARAEKVIEDMLEDPDTDMMAGKIEIHDVYPINKDVVEFIIYVHPMEMKSQENPHVRKIMLGDAKAKK
jgi:hypothetical protein